MHTDYLFEMMQTAKDARVRGSGRITYTPRQKALAVLFAEESFKKGMTVNDAAHLLSMHASTLKGWVEHWDKIPLEAIDEAGEEIAACHCYCCRQRFGEVDEAEGAPMKPHIVSVS